MHIIALATCHNRKQCTLNALMNLYNQKLPIDVTLSIVIVDDGSSDGTSNAIFANFPDVKIIQGDGNLFWSGGMRFGWDQWVKNQEIDALLVFNDDIYLNNNAISELIYVLNYAQSQFGPLVVISGAFTDKTGEYCTYGGSKRSSLWNKMKFSLVNPNGAPQKIDVPNMNCTLISSETLSKIGFLADYFSHAGADYEYGLRTCEAGGEVWMTGGYIGKCDRNKVDLSIGSRQRLYEFLYGTKSMSPKNRAKYFSQYGGVFWPVFWIFPYVRLALLTVFDIVFNNFKK